MTSTAIERVGQRIRLREWRADEVDGFHRWVADPLVTRFLSWGATTREESARQLADAIAAQRDTPRTRYFLAIERRAVPGRTIGDCGFTWIEPRLAESDTSSSPNSGVGVSPARRLAS